MGEPIHNRRQLDDVDASFSLCPRYQQHDLSAEQIELIVEKAARRGVAIAREEFYKDVGQTVVSKWFIIIGMGTVALYAWARSKNII